MVWGLFFFFGGVDFFMGLWFFVSGGGVLLFLCRVMGGFFNSTLGTVASACSALWWENASGAVTWGCSSSLEAANTDPCACSGPEERVCGPVNTEDPLSSLQLKEKLIKPPGNRMRFVSEF